MNSRRLTGSPLRVGRRQTTTPSRARMPLCANREKGWPLLDPYGALVHEHGAVRHNQDSALTSSQARGSFRFPRPSNGAHPLRWPFAVQAATGSAAADQVHDRRPLRGSFFGAFTLFWYRRISRSSQPSRSVTSWRNCEFSNSSSAILSASPRVRSGGSFCGSSRVVAISTLECLLAIAGCVPCSPSFWEQVATPFARRKSGKVRTCFCRRVPSRRLCVVK
jgi:hypothetical protein